MAERDRASTRGDLRILIVAEHASARFGGEAILPLHYFRVLRRRGIDVRLIVNARTRVELERIFSDDLDRIHFIPDTRVHRLLAWVGRPLPGQLRYFTTSFVGRVYSQILARQLARQLIRAHRIHVVHQPTPVSPKESSLLYDLGVPVVIGPMNGGMVFPPAFARSQGRLVPAAMGLGRSFSGVMNRLMPGKLRAAILLVANERTCQALPSHTRGRILTLVENGVDLTLWSPADSPPAGVAPQRADRPFRFIFIGRLVDWKAVDLLLLAFSQIMPQARGTLAIVGDGPERVRLERQVESLELGGCVTFYGWLPQADCARHLREADALALPSLYESGGAVVLEAMAAGVPVIATDWGGPADYLDSSCGILVAPASRASFVAGLTGAMLKLAADPALCRVLGRTGRLRVEQSFDWERKVDRILEIYAEVVQ